VYKGKRAKPYPFTLDNFQEISIACLVKSPALFTGWKRDNTTTLRAATILENVHGVRYELQWNE